MTKFVVSIYTFYLINIHKQKMYNNLYYFFYVSLIFDRKYIILLGLI